MSLYSVVPTNVQYPVKTNLYFQEPDDGNCDGEIRADLPTYSISYEVSLWWGGCSNNEFMIAF